MTARRAAALAAALAVVPVLGLASGAVGCSDARRPSTPPASTGTPPGTVVPPPPVMAGAPGGGTPAGVPLAPVATAPVPVAAAAAARVRWFPDDASIAARVAALADPALRGRGHGTADEAAAADKVAAWFRQIGLEPGGVDGGYQVPFSWLDVRSQNVVGILRGSDPSAGHVVVGAHVDHLGVVEGAIHPGADDNASGVAGLCAIAEALARAGQRPRPTVVLVAFGAEEIGLLGSEAYVRAPALPLADARLMINLDMIGRARFLAADAYALAHTVVPAEAIGVLASPGADDLIALARRAAATIGRPLVSPSDFGALERLLRPAMETRSDQASFAAAGVRYLWFSTSMHDDYHRPSDTLDKVDPVTVAAVARLVAELVLSL